MREIVLDTETTGFEPETGDRIVEIGALELLGHIPTGRSFHVYINPERPMPEAAFAVHGLGDEFLRDKPVFAQVAQDFVEFIGDARLVIHNAAFDMKFLNHELGRLGYPVMPMDRAVDTVLMARRKFPGSPASLDALCRRFGIDNSGRTLHGRSSTASSWPRSIWSLIEGRSRFRPVERPAAPRAGRRRAAGTPPGGRARAEALPLGSPRRRPRPCRLRGGAGRGALWLPEGPAPCATPLIVRGWSGVERRGAAAACPACARRASSLR
jgi:DNA polymerase-3 subunit epsilon